MAQAVCQERPRGLGWTLLRTVAASDGSTPTTSVFTADDPIRTPFVDLLFVVTGGAWGSVVAEVVEIVDRPTAGVDAGYIVKQAFKDCSDSLTVNSDRIVPGVSASGRITVKITSFTTLTELKIWVRPS